MTKRKTSKNLQTNGRTRVFCPVERKGKTTWTKVGFAYPNADGSISVYLEAFPANGKLLIKDEEC